MTSTQTPNTWFRMYAEFANDPKVQMLSEVDQRRYVMLLCLRCGNGDETLHDQEVAFQLRIDTEDWVSTKAVLVSKGLVLDDNSIPSWDKRQYRSDSSTERVRAHRERMKQEGNVSETPPDTETDTETEVKKQTKKASIDTTLFDTFWNHYPRKTNKPKAIAAFDKLKVNDDLLAKMLSNIDQRLSSGDWSKDNKEFIPHPSTYLNNCRWEDEVIPKKIGANHAGSTDPGAELAQRVYERGISDLEDESEVHATVPEGVQQQGAVIDSDQRH